MEEDLRLKRSTPPPPPPIASLYQLLLFAIVLNGRKLDNRNSKLLENLYSSASSCISTNFKFRPSEFHTGQNKVHVLVCGAHCTSTNNQALVEKYKTEVMEHLTPNMESFSRSIKICNYNE